MKNMKVASKLVLTFSATLLLFIVTACLLFGQVAVAMRNMNYFYEHPFQVTKAARDVNSELLTMRVLAKDIILIGDPAAMGQLKARIDACDARIAGHIAVLDRQYLGDHAEIAELRVRYCGWRNIADEAIALAEGGDRNAAAMLSAGPASEAAGKVLAVLDGITQFADGKAAEFQRETQNAHDRAVLVLVLLSAAAVAVAGALAFLLTRNIVRPLNAMMGVIQSVEAGEQAVRVKEEGRADELGKLTGAFNGMLTYLKTQRELSEMAWTLERQRTLEQFRITLMSIGDAFISTDTAGNIVNMNSTAERLTGWTLEDAKGSPIYGIFHIINAKTGAPAENPLEMVIRLGIVVGLANHTVLISRTGARYHISDSAAPITDDDGKLTGVVLVFRDVTEEYLRQEEISFLSFHDKLTGLYNRAFLEEEIKRIRSGRQMPLSIVMADINGLKLINDAFGHQRGDQYLVAAAETLKRCCRADDIIARWGGDEFVLLLPKASEAESQRICARISDACQRIDGFPIKLSMALGCAVADASSGDYLATLKLAETNMYRHKLLESRSVRNAIVTSLASSLNEKNYHTKEHAQSMVESCRETGLYLGLKDSLVDELELLAKLHDIGKIAISESILMKPDLLTEEEGIEMKKHVEIGFRIAKSIPELEHIAEGILLHHERWDGGGYPRGLAGESIPYTARIVSVADAYDAMTRGRPYKSAISHEEAMAELRRCAGGQFDPAVVEAFERTAGAWKCA